METGKKIEKWKPPAMPKDQELLEVMQQEETNKEKNQTRPLTSVSFPTFCLHQTSAQGCLFLLLLKSLSF